MIVTDHPWKPFNDAVAGKQPEKDNSKDQDHEANHIRDKDNADRRYPPPRFELGSTSSHAPRGGKGIERNLSTPQEQKAKDEFRLEGPGDLTREFKPIAKGEKDQNRDR